MFSNGSTATKRRLSAAIDDDVQPASAASGERTNDVTVGRPAGTA
jgi:hypothetical protein